MSTAQPQPSSPTALPARLCAPLSLFRLRGKKTHAIQIKPCDPPGVRIPEEGSNDRRTRVRMLLFHPELCRGRCREKDSPARESFRMPCIRKDSRLLCSDFVSWLQQSDKTGLFEVMVGSEGVADAVLGHEEKTDGIAQGPVLVEPLL